MKKLHAVVGVAVALSLAGTAAWAGAKTVVPVTISPSASTTWVSGTIGSARNSANTNETIGCALYAYSNVSAPSSIQCYARNAAGTYISCTSTAPALVNAMSAITSDSYITFVVDTSGSCTHVYINNSSYFEPKAP